MSSSSKWKSSVFPLAVLVEKERVPPKVLVVPKDHIPGFQLPHKIGEFEILIRD